MHTHYSHEFLASQKEKLQTSKLELEAELHKIARYDDASGTYIAMQPEFDSGSSEDNAENSMEAEVGQTNMAMVSNLGKALSDASAALSKMEAGKYGICESTGDWIGEDRLNAYPAARTCDGEGEIER